jgi:hypothetical protein
MLVEWWENGYPGWVLTDQPGSPTSLDGHPARIQQGPRAAPACSGLDATTAISVLVARPGAPSNYLEFVACLRGPHLSRQRALALMMLRSLRIRSD